MGIKYFVTSWIVAIRPHSAYMATQTHLVIHKASHANVEKAFKWPYFGNIYRVQKDACGDCTAACNKLANPVFHALRRLPVAGVFFGPPPADSTSADVPDRSARREDFANTNNDYGSRDIHDEAHPHPVSQGE